MLFTPFWFLKGLGDVGRRSEEGACRCCTGKASYPEPLPPPQGIGAAERDLRQWGKWHTDAAATLSELEARAWQEAFRNSWRKGNEKALGLSVRLLWGTMKRQVEKWMKVLSADMLCIPHKETEGNHDWNNSIPL